MIWELSEGKRKPENNKKEENAICRTAVHQRLLNTRGNVHVCSLYVVLMFVTMMCTYVC